MNVKVAGPAPEADDPQLAHARKLTLAVYVLHALSWVTFVTYFVAIVLNHTQRGQVAGTIYESHFTWQIRTFWFSLLYLAIGLALLVTGIVALVGKSSGGTGLVIAGIVLLAFNVCWHLYRVIRGLVNWSDRKPL
jgi:uncharacterized membrane protein